MDQYGKAPRAEAKQAEAEAPSLPALSLSGSSPTLASHSLFAAASAPATERGAYAAAEEPPVKPSAERFLAPVQEQPGRLPPIPQASPLTLTSRASSQTLSVSPLSSFGASEPDEAEQEQLRADLEEVTAKFERLEDDEPSLSFPLK